MNIQKKFSNQMLFERKYQSLKPLSWFPAPLAKKDDTDDIDYINNAFITLYKYCYQIHITGLELDQKGKVLIKQAWQPMELYSDGSEFYGECNYNPSIYYAILKNSNNPNLEWKYLGNKALIINHSSIKQNNVAIYLISNQKLVISDIMEGWEDIYQGQIQIQKDSELINITVNGYLDSLTWGDDYSQWRSIKKSEETPGLYEDIIYDPDSELPESDAMKYHRGFKDISMGVNYGDYGNKPFIFKNSHFTTLPTQLIENINGYYKGTFEGCKIDDDVIFFKPTYNYHNKWGASSDVCAYTDTFKNIENCKSLYLDFTSLKTAQMEFNGSSFAVGTSVTYVQLDYSSSKGFGYTWFVNPYLKNADSGPGAFEIYDNSSSQYVCNISPTATIVINIPAGEESDYLGKEGEGGNFTPVANMKGFLPKGFKGTVKFPNLSQDIVDEIKKAWTGSGTANPDEEENNYITFIGKDPEDDPEDDSEGEVVGGIVHITLQYGDGEALKIEKYFPYKKTSEGKYVNPTWKDIYEGYTYQSKSEGMDEGIELVSPNFILANSINNIRIDGSIIYANKSLGALEKGYVYFPYINTADNSSMNRGLMLISPYNSADSSSNGSVVKPGDPILNDQTYYLLRRSLNNIKSGSITYAQLKSDESNGKYYPTKSN